MAQSTTQLLKQPRNYAPKNSPKSTVFHAPARECKQERGGLLTVLVPFAALPSTHDRYDRDSSLLKESSLVALSAVEEQLRQESEVEPG